ncbi:unnamed protein product, partial [Pylaiella littoralis]
CFVLAYDAHDVVCVGVPFLLVSSLVAWAAHCLWHHPTRDNGLLTTLKLVPGPCSLDVKNRCSFIFLSGCARARLFFEVLACKLVCVGVCARPPLGLFCTRL